MPANRINSLGIFSLIKGDKYQPSVHNSYCISSIETIFDFVKNVWNLHRKWGQFYWAFIVLATAFYNTSAEDNIAAIVSAAAVAVSADWSLTGTMLSNLVNLNYKIDCSIEVENWKNFSLTDPVVKIIDGALSTPHGDILPCRKDAMVARKSSDTATGTFGTVSWLVKEHDRRIVIMWAVPYDYNLYSNWLGVGITTPGVTIHAQRNEWFKQMYYGTSSDSLGFSRSKCYWESNTLIYKDDLIQISGIMTTGHQAYVRITVRPLNVSDLATNIEMVLDN